MTLLPYELAAKLKDAGWPQPQSKEAVEAMEGDYLVGPEIPYYSPSLSELIAACPQTHINGDVTGYFLLGVVTGHFLLGDQEYSKTFLASYLPGRQLLRPSGLGNTPEEAVAYLWLALKKEGIV